MASAGSRIRHFDCRVCGKHVRLTNFTFRWVHRVDGSVLSRLDLERGALPQFHRTNTHTLAHFRRGEISLDGLLRRN